MKNILLVEDDTSLSFMTKDYLDNCGFSVECTSFGEDVHTYLKERPIDLVILDIELDGKMNGFEVAEKMRSHCLNTPIVFTTCLTKPEDMKRAFNIDYSDYIRKPFGLNELLLRMERFLEKPPKKCTIIKLGSLCLNTEERFIQNVNEIIHISNHELIVIKKLSEQINQIVPKEEIMQALWPYHVDLKSKELSLNNLICSLRKYLSQAGELITIDNIRGYGYRLNVKET